jgi:hypothetical protein
METLQEVPFARKMCLLSVGFMTHKPLEATTGSGAIFLENCLSSLSVKHVNQKIAELVTKACFSPVP